MTQSIIQNYNSSKNSIHQLYKEKEPWLNVTKNGRDFIVFLLKRTHANALALLNPDPIMDKTTQRDDLLQLSSEVNEIQKWSRRFMENQYVGLGEKNPQKYTEELRQSCDLLEKASQSMSEKSQSLQKQILSEAATELATVNVLPKDCFRVVAEYFVD
jgi:lysyl-tRNA synthetase class I